MLLERPGKAIFSDVLISDMTVKEGDDHLQITRNQVLRILRSRQMYLMDQRILRVGVRQVPLRKPS